MRSVLFNKFIPVEFEKIEGISYRKRVEGTGFYESGYQTKGLFHEWGVAYEEDEGGYGSFSVALVECQDGTITEVIPKNLKFEFPSK